MRNGLIRITGEKDIFYDSIEKVYRYRMHCPNCHKVIPQCMCYNDIGKLMNDIDDGIADFTCSSKCALLMGDWDELDEAMQHGGICKDANELIKGISDEDIIIFLNKEFKSMNLKIKFDNYIRKDLLVVINENQLEDGLLEELDISKGKSIEELTEEEALKVLNILTDDYDGDYPSGDFCNS